MFAVDTFSEPGLSQVRKLDPKRTVQSSAPAAPVRAARVRGRSADRAAIETKGGEGLAGAWASVVLVKFI